MEDLAPAVWNYLLKRAQGRALKSFRSRFPCQRITKRDLVYRHSQRLMTGPGTTCSGYKIRIGLRGGDHFNNYEQWVSAEEIPDILESRQKLKSAQVLFNLGRKE